MDDISAQLRRWSAAIADAAPATPINDVEPGAPTAPGGRTRTRLLAAAASVVVVAAGVTAIAVFGGDNDPAPAIPTDTTTPESSTTIPSSTSTTSTTAPPVDRLAGWPARPSERLPVDAVPLLISTMPIPGAEEPLRTEFQQSSLAPPTFAQVFANAERDVVVMLQTQPSNQATMAPQPRPVDLDGWESAYHAGSGRSIYLAANDPSGWVRLIGNGLDEAEAETIVRDMRRRDPGVPGWDLPPDSDLIEINGAWHDNYPERQLLWYAGTRPMAEMHASPGFTNDVRFVLGSQIERVDINGVEGWYDPTGAGSVAWSPDGITIVVLRVDATSGIDALAFARSFIEVDESTYNSMTTTEPPEGLGDGCQSLFC